MYLVHTCLIFHIHIHHIQFFWRRLSFFYTNHRNLENASFPPSNIHVYNHRTDILRSLGSPPPPSPIGFIRAERGSCADYSPSLPYNTHPAPPPMNPSESILGGGGLLVSKPVFSRQKHAQQPRTVLMGQMRTTKSLA
jgi:hypothetical protein